MSKPHKEHLEFTVAPRDALPVEHQLEAIPPEEIFANLSTLERQAVLAYVEAGSYKDAVEAIDRWRTNEGKSADQVTALTSKIFFKPRVRGAISKLQAFWGEQAPIQAARVLSALEAQAFADPALVYQDNGGSWELKPLNEWPLALRQCVQKIHYTEITSGYGRLKRTTRRVSVDFANRQTALEMLGRHLRLFDAHKEQTVPFTLVVNTVADQDQEPKRVGPQVIEGVGLQIRVPEP